MQPFEPEPLKDEGGPLDHPCMEIEGGSHAEKHAVDPFFVGRHPDFLFRAAESDEDQSGAGAVDRFDVGLCFFFRPVAETRTQGATDVQPGEMLPQVGFEQIQGLGCRSEQKDTGSPRLGGLAERPHEVGTRDTPLVGMTLAAHDPGDRCAVRQHHVRRFEGLRQPRIVQGGDRRMDVAETDGARLASGAPVQDALDRLMLVRRIDEGLENPCSWAYLRLLAGHGFAEKGDWGRDAQSYKLIRVAMLFKHQCGR